MGHQTMLRHLIGIVLVIPSLFGCAALSAPPTAIPPPTATSTPTPIPPTETPTPVLPTATPTPVPPTRTPRPTATERAIVVTSRMENGWMLYEMPVEGFGIALPPDWQRFELDPQALRASVEALKETNPEMADVLEQQARYFIASGNLKFLGFDMALESQAASYPTYVEVIRLPVIVKLFLDSYVHNAIKDLERVPNIVKPVSSRRVSLPAGEAAELRFGLQFAGPTGQAITLSVTEYFVPTTQELFTIACSTTSEQAEEYAPIFEQIAQSFELLE